MAWEFERKGKRINSQLLEFTFDTDFRIVGLCSVARVTDERTIEITELPVSLLLLFFFFATPNQ